MRTKIVFVIIIVFVVAFLRWIAFNNDYLGFMLKPATFVLGNPDVYIFEPQEPMEVEFTINGANLDAYRNKELLEFDTARLVIDSVSLEAQDGWFLRVVLVAKQKGSFLRGSMLAPAQDLPGPQVTEITAHDEHGNNLEAYYMGASAWGRRSRDYHYAICIDKDNLQETEITVHISNVTPVRYKRS